MTDLDHSIALVRATAPGGDVAASLIEHLGPGRIDGARREALTMLQAGRTPRTRDLLRLLDALDEAMDRLDADRRASH